MRKLLYAVVALLILAQVAFAIPPGGGGGGTGATIDDGAGNGDTAVVWSADKTFDQFALKQTADANLTALSIANLATPGANSLVGHTSAGAFANYTAVDLGLTTGKFWQGVDSKAAEVSISERIGATFVGTGAGGVIEANQSVFVSVPYAVSSIDSWTVICDQDSGATGIIITPYSDAYVEDDIALTPMCTTGVIPHTSDGATAGGTSHQAAWDCNITSLAANSVVQFKVTTAPTAATSCSVTLKVTR
jgi:hypothetical protein